MPTDAQIEAAAKAIYAQPSVHGHIEDWDDDSEKVRHDCRAEARAALEAAEALEEVEWEYAWEADEEKRARMSPRGPRLMIDGYFAPPEQIAEFPKGRRVRRRKAGPWIALEGETP